MAVEQAERVCSVCCFCKTVKASPYTRHVRPLGAADRKEHPVSSELKDRFKNRLTGQLKLPTVLFDILFDFTSEEGIDEYADYAMKDQDYNTEQQAVEVSKQIGQQRTGLVRVPKIGRHKKRRERKSRKGDHNLSE